MSETTFAEQLQKFQQAFDALISIAEQYPAESQTTPGVTGEWSAREVLAHINGWIVEAQRRFPRYAKGTGNIDYNIDAFNAVSVWLRDGKDFEQILDETRKLVAKMLTMANDLADVYIERDKRYGEWLNILSEEAENHGEQLRTFLEAKA